MRLPLRVAPSSLVRTDPCSRKRQQLHHLLIVLVCDVDWPLGADYRRTSRAVVDRQSELFEAVILRRLF